MGRLNLIRWAKACKGSGGIISLIAKRLSVDRSAIYLYLEREPRAHYYLKEAKEEILDVAESHLIKGITDGDKEDIKWYLSRLGRHRGYIANPEVQVIGKQTNIDVGYKFIIEKPDDFGNTLETEQEAINSL